MKQKIMQEVSKYYLGYAAEKGTSLYTITARALRKCGYKSDYLSDKEFVTLHKEQVLSLHKKIDKKKLKENKYIKSDDFLSSYEWRKLRLEALLKYGRRCLCCGNSPDSGAVLNVDHILPRKTHPELALDINNLQVLCNDCNHGKGNWNTTDFRIGN